MRVLGKGGEENIVPVEDAEVEANHVLVATHDSIWTENLPRPFTDHRQLSLLGQMQEVTN